MSDFTVERMPIPDTLDSPGGADFVEMVAMRNAIEAELMGTMDASPTPEDLLPRWQDPYSPQVLFVARVDGRLVGRATLALPLESENVGWLTVEVAPAFRRRGIGAALYDASIEHFAAQGRTVIQGETLTPDAADDRIPSPTGFGSMPRTPGTRFALARGFELEQVMRASRLDLPFDTERLLADAVAASGPDFRVVTWEGRTPEEYVDDIAVLHSRMSTDAPSADLEVGEEEWDADRVRSLDDMREKTGTATLLAVVQHVPSGRLVAFSELSVPRERELVVHQFDTLVHGEFRGHRLGMLVKLANLHALEQRHPGHPAVITFNAEENRHMLVVNEAIGFVAFAFEGAWKKPAR